MKRLLLAAPLLACALCLDFLAAAEPVGGAAGAPLQPSAELAARIDPLITAHRGDVGVAIKHLGTGVGFVYCQDEPMPTASLIKLAVMATAYQQVSAGQLQLDQLLPLRESDKVPGSGILTTHFSAGTQLTLRDAIRLMIAYSDNTATNMVIDAIGLPSTAEWMSETGFPNTKLHSKVYRRDTSIFPERSQQFGLGSTTAAETVALLERIDRGQIVSREACDQMLEHLYACEDRGKLVRLLPPTVRVAHKSGYVSQSRVDAGLIDGPDGRIAICVLTDQNADRGASDENEASLLIANIAHTTYRFFYPAASTTSDSHPLLGLAISASGPRVESLQRILNERSLPSPGLTVDGEFGPATESALMDFQRAHALAATGNVDDPTLKAIEASAVNTATTNARINGAADSVAKTDAADRDDEKSLSELTAETLDGPPVVSCRAWAVGDATTGELLYQHNASRKLDNASTTKLMTAWLVAKLASQHPEILEEELDFSERADKTNGSTAGLKAGEKIRVSDLLYGLLLPSGNDASVALAEHVGSRLHQPDNARRDDAQQSDAHQDKDAAGEAYESFIAAMNQEAAALGLTQTEFKNPHGLTAAGHGCSAGDLVKVAQLVLRDPLLSKIVSTRRYRCEVVAADGTARTVTWNNTNQLLDIEGYDGAKTGTTSAAGACLVASGQRNGRRLIVVVLGSSGSDARYADARNLFRWAWQQPSIGGQ